MCLLVSFGKITKKPCGKKGLGAGETGSIEKLLVGLERIIADEKSCQKIFSDVIHSFHAK